MTMAEVPINSLTEHKSRRGDRANRYYQMKHGVGTDEERSQMCSNIRNIYDWSLVGLVLRVTFSCPY
jgi:hypothetical protein